MTTTSQKVNTFYHSQVEQALENCQTAGYQPLFMPQLADGRMNGTQPWNQWRTTPSIRATGRTQQGAKIVVYAHMPTSLATPEGIRTAKQDPVNGAGRFSQEEFQKLCDQDGRIEQGERVIWVVDYNVLRKAPSGPMAIAQALGHPQTIPFLGGQERAERYLPAHARAYNTETIGNWHTDDFDKKTPLARLLCLGDVGDGGLLGDGSLGYVGQFAGVRNASAEGATQKIVTYTPQQITQALKQLNISGLETQILRALKENSHA